MTRAYPLLDRAPGAVLFRSRRPGPGGARTGADFLGHVAALASTLPDAPWLVNCCADRYWFAVVLAAGLVRNRPNLLASDHSPANLALLARLYPGAVSVTDREAPEGPLPFHRVGHGPMGHGPMGHGPIGQGPDAPNPDIPGDRLAAVVFTSGTTGEPTAHPKPWGGLVERTRAAGLRFGFTEAAPAAVVGTVPPQHMYGFETTLLLPLHAAASAWSDTVFWPADVRDALAARPGAAGSVTTPLHLRALVDAGLSEPPAMVVSATAPLPAALAESAERLWGAEVHEIFGATEVGSIASRRTVRDEPWTTYPDVSLCPTLEAPVVHAPFLEPRALSDDIELLDESRFRLIGRGNDLVKMGGRRASHAGLNHILTRIAGVEDGVFLLPDEDDARPSARLTVVVAAPGLSDAHLLAELRTRIDPVFMPRRIVRVRVLPRNAVGKLTSEALRGLRDSAGRT